MSLQQREAALRPEGNQPHGCDPELIRLYQQTKRAYAALKIHDEINVEVMNLLERVAEQEPNPNSPLATHDDAKDLTTNIMNVT